MSGYNHIASVRGSSPRVWGQVDKQIRDVATTGIIPTRMGTSDDLSDSDKRTGDHPHAYGDKAALVSDLCTLLGSSPRVWGQVFLPSSAQTCCRIIPTRMGTSRAFSISDNQCRDHPHAYGDKLITIIKQIIERGSSPRVWGQA